MTNFDFNSIYILLLNIFFVILFLILIFYIFNTYLVQREEERKQIQDKAYKKALKILEDSQAQALSTIKASNVKAQEIIKNTHALTSETKDELHAKIEEETNRQIKEIEKSTHDMYMTYHAALQKESARNLGTLHKMLKDVESEVVNELNEFKNIVKEETINSEKTVQERINKDYEDLRAELDNYRDEKYQEIDKNINTILFNVSKSVLGVAIDLEIHQQLVLESLEKAKKEALFE